MNEFKLSTSSASPDEEAVKSLLNEIRTHVELNELEAAAVASSKLKEESRPQYTMDVAAPYLFLEGTDETGTWTSHDALSVVTYLVSSDPASYLTPASRAVKSSAKHLSSPSGINESMVVSDELLNVLVAQLSGDNVEASSNASEAVALCCRRLGPPLSDRAIRAITDSWKQALEQMPSDRSRYSTISVRCACAIVDVVILGDAPMESAVQSGATDLLLRMATDETDPLLQMSTLDLIEKLTNTFPMHSNRARWLFSHKILHPLLVMSGGIGEDIGADPILGGAALRLLSSLCRLTSRDSSLFQLGGSELLTGFHHALRNFGGNGELEHLAFIDAVSSFASASPDALEVVLEDEMVRERWLSLKVAQPKLKSVVLKSVSMVLDPSTEVDANGDTLTTSTLPSNSLSMRLYQTLGQVNNSDSTALAVSLAKSSLVVTRLGAYSLLEAVAKQGSGAQVLLSHHGFFEFLVSREGEQTKEGKEAKFAIVEAVLNSDARGLLSENVVNSLEKIKGEGPHYVKTQSWDVAIE